MPARLIRPAAHGVLLCACLGVVAGLAGCDSSGPTKHAGGASSGAQTLRVHVTEPPARTSDADCRFRLTGPLPDGGRQDVCLETVDGFPAPGATTTAHGVLTLDEPGGTLVADVTVTQVFADDGQHATQEMEGRVIEGSGERFAGWHGTVSGTGRLTDSASGISSVDLTWTFTSR